MISLETLQESEAESAGLAPSKGWHKTFSALRHPNYRYFYTGQTVSLIGTWTRTAALGWIDMAGDPVIQRIMLVDAPSVLGWEQWRAMDEGRTVGAMRDMLQAVSDSGRLPQELVGPFSYMIVAALDEAAMVVARAPDSGAAVAEGRRAVEELLNRLLRP